MKSNLEHKLHILQIVILKETRNSSKIRLLDFEKKFIAQLRKMFCKIPMKTRATITVMLLC